MGRIARRATSRPPRNASAVPPSTPKARKRRTRLIVVCTLASVSAYWTQPISRATGRGIGSKVPSVCTSGTTSCSETTRKSPASVTPSIGGPSSRRLVA